MWVRATFIISVNMSDLFMWPDFLWNWNSFYEGWHSKTSGPFMGVYVQISYILYIFVTIQFILVKPVFHSNLVFMWNLLTNLSKLLIIGSKILKVIGPQCHQSTKLIGIGLPCNHSIMQNYWYWFTCKHSIMHNLVILFTV